MKRYTASITIGENGEQIPWMYEDPEGDFVLYSDVSAIFVEIQREVERDEVR